MTDAVAKLLAAAESKVGYREGPNNATMFGTWYGWPNVAWCAQFVSWCADQAGVLGESIPKFQYCPTGLEWFRSRGQTGNWPPQPGDIGFVRRLVDGVWRTPHVFIVKAYLGDGRVQTLEGNTNDDGSPTGDGVYSLIRRDSEGGSGYIYARPKYPTTTQEEDDMFTQTDRDLMGYISRQAKAIGDLVANSQKAITAQVATLGQQLLAADVDDATKAEVQDVLDQLAQVAAASAAVADAVAQLGDDPSQDVDLERVYDAARTAVADVIGERLTVRLEASAGTEASA